MKRLGKQQIAIARYFKRLGGHGTIADARKAAGVAEANYHIKKLREAGCMNRIARNDYSLAKKWSVGI
jgi:hypothetical protein